MRLNSLAGAFAFAVVLMLPVGSASAEVRSGSVTDPADAYLHQNVDGTSYRDQDIQRVTASYDTAGSITMTFYFLDPLPNSSLDALSESSTPDALNASFNDGNGNDPEALVTVFPSISFHPASVSISGYEGSIEATSIVSADHRAITVQASAPVLANRAYSWVPLVELWHYDEYFHCDRYICSNLSKAITDHTDSFDIDAATPAFPLPEPEATATPKPTVTPTDRCVAARDALRTKQERVKKLKARRRSTHKRERRAALAERIDTIRRGIAKTRAVIEQSC